MKFRPSLNPFKPLVAAKERRILNRFLVDFDDVYPSRYENSAKSRRFIKRLAAVAQGPHSPRGTFKLNFLLGLAYYYLLQDTTNARAAFYQALAADYSGPGLEMWDKFRYFMKGHKIYYHAAKMERLLENYPAARALVVAGLAKDPSEYDFYMERMEINFAQKNYTAAIRDSKLIWQTSQEYNNRLQGYAEDKMYYIRAQSYEALGKLNEAVACYDKLIKVFAGHISGDQYKILRDILIRKIERDKPAAEFADSNRGR